MTGATVGYLGLVLILSLAPVWGEAMWLNPDLPRACGIH